MSKAGTMKAIVFQDTGKFVYTDRPVPEISRPDDVKFNVGYDFIRENLLYN